MELDVNLSREGDEPWGFRLIGGTDFKMPLTVVKVLTDSPAERAGLQNGDTVSRIDDKVADDMSHDDARQIVDGAKMTLQLGVKRGLYDPVLDNYEPIYEDVDQIDLADTDQPLQPTEVLDTFKIQQFLDPNQDICPLNGLSETLKPSESRSLTASPFVLPAKPYRPFSTEPLPEIPPLEDPIILNPNYRDEFGKIIDGFDELELINGKYESKFKLPISEQYDPDWEKRKKEILEKEKKDSQVKTTEVKTQDVSICSAKKESQITSEKTEQMMKEDIAFMKKMKQEIDIDKIELTATNIVDESIEKATTVAKEIKKEIDVELSDVSVISTAESKSITKSTKQTSEMTSEIQESSVQRIEKSYESVQSDIVTEHEDLGIVKREEYAAKESKEVTERSDNTTKEIEVNVAKKVEKFETIDSKDNVSDERKKSVQQEVEESIEAGSVRRKSMIFDKEEAIVDTKAKSVQDVKVRQAKVADKDEKIQAKVIVDRGENISKVSSSVEQNASTTTSKLSDSKTSTSKAEHRAYTIGLKTIPNIRGTVHSSYHYNLLLQTFFLHLTDVMVALSRFILSEPIFDKVQENSDKITTQQMSSSAYESKSEVIAKQHEAKQHEDVAKVSESKAAHNEAKIVKSTAAHQNQAEKTVVQEKKEPKDVQEVKKEIKSQELVVENSYKQVEKEKVEKIIIQEDNLVDHEVAAATAAFELKTHKRAVSGSEMAQLSEKKSEELTVKMDAVISEFENKTGIEEVSERLRSRSRSQVVEEVMKASDPLEWLSTVDSQKSQEITEVKTSSEFRSSVESAATKKEISTAVNTAAEKKIESRHGSRARSSTPNRQMYVAIVESHVYTNSDAILLDQTDISETASVQSVEETNMAIESISTMATENVTMERSEIKEHKAHIVEERKEESKQIAIEQNRFEAISKKEENKQIEGKIQESTQVVSKHTDVKTMAKQEEVKQIEEIVEETKEPVVEQIKVKAVQSDIKTQVAVQQITEPIVELYESKHIDIKEESQKVSIKEESLEIAKKETVEIQEIVSESVAYEEEHETHGHVELAKEDLAVVKEEQTLELDVSADVKIEKAEIKDTEPKIESAALKIVKEQVIEVQPSPEILESEETKVLKMEKIIDLSKAAIVESESKFVDISESSSLDSIDVKSKTAIQESSFTARSSVQQSEASFTATSISQSVQESSFIAKSTASAKFAESGAKKLTLKTDISQHILEQQSSVSSDENNNIDTPTSSTVPPTPVTDEYVFKLQIPLPKTSGIVIPLEETPEANEDPHIVKKKLVPHIETTLESPVIYDPPLPSPPGSKVGSPVYTKPGLRGGNIRCLKKEEILEIERKSTLLASAIDETIKSIEEYKEQVGMETKKEESTIKYSKSENYSKEESSITILKTEVKSKLDDEWSKVDKQVDNNNRTLTELSKLAIEDRKVETKTENLVNGHIEDINDNAIENKHVLIRETNQENGTCERIADNTESGKVNLEEKVVETVDLRIRAEESLNSTEEKKISMSNEEYKLTNGDTRRRNVFVDVGRVPKDDVIDNEILPRVELAEEIIKDEKEEVVEEKEDPMKGYRPVVFNPEPRNPRPTGVYIDMPPNVTGRPYTTPTGELLGSHQGIVDGLEEAIVDEEVAKELGKPGMTEDKIAELISGESEMLREAHVMGLTRVLTSHMSRADDDSSVDFKKIKPIVESLKDSEVLKALNDELTQTKAEKKKEERKWTKFLQKPKRAVPRAKFGYHGYLDQEEEIIEAPYKVKIVKQPKPKVAPDYKPENFDTGPLPWEERALLEPPPPPVEAEEPILVPEEVPEFLEAVDPLPESEVPDLEETGITLPPPKTEEEIKPPTPQPIEEVPAEVIPEPEPIPEPKPETKEDMENRIAEQLMTSVQNMVDPNASLEQQLAQMRAQLAALAQLPGVIQQTLELVTRQLSQISQQETVSIQASHQSHQSLSMEQTQQCLALNEVTENHEPTISEETVEDVQKEEQNVQIEEVQTPNEQAVEEKVETQPSLTQEEMEKLRKEEEEMLEEQRRIEKQKKEMMEQMRLDQESRQVKQRPTPRVGKPKPVFGNGDQEPRPLVLPGGRKWRGPKDAYNDQFIAETLTAQAELIQGKAMGKSYESDILPYDERVNFLKYEKPPVSLDHLQHSEVFKMVHGMDQTPLRRVDLLTPVVAESDYREKCRSISPCVGRMAQEQHQDIPQQVQP